MAGQNCKNRRFAAAISPFIFRNHATEELIQKAKTAGFVLLPVSLAHIQAYRQIPFHTDHRGPFDRLILATALAEQMPIISADEKFSRYRDVVKIIW